MTENFQGPDGSMDGQDRYPGTVLILDTATFVQSIVLLSVLCTSDKHNAVYNAETPR